MKLGVSWRVKGVQPEARESAEEAARRSGQSLGEWLNTAIIQQAQQSQKASPPIGDREVQGDNFAAPERQRNEPAPRVEQLAYAGLAAYAPKRSRSAASQPVAAPPPEIPSVRLPPGLDLAVAEIAERQRTLNGSAPPARPQQPSVPSAPMQNLAGLEDQLRNITKQIETLRKPGVEHAINALREELGEIGRSIRDALPRRALEAIETQIRSVDRRVAESRQAGVDASALRGIEHGLADIRDAMRGLMPAENLVGYTDAVADLAHKIDLIVAQNDPATIAQLEHSITTLREMSNHIASNETVRGLAVQVQELGEKIDVMARAGSARDEGAFGHLEQRIAMLSDLLAERDHADAAVSQRLEQQIEALGDKVNHLAEQSAPDGTPSSRVEALFEALGDKIDHLAQQSAPTDGAASPQLEALFEALADKIDHLQMQGFHDDGATSQRLEALLESLADKIDHVQLHSAQSADDAFAHLEDRIVSLVEKLDASDARLGHLEGIERGVADLLLHIEDMRANSAAVGVRAQELPGVDDLRHDIARTHDALDAVHGTLGHVVDRLAIIESDIRGQAYPQVAAVARPAAVVDEGAATGSFATQQAPRPIPPVSPSSSEPDLADNEPLEPGSGPPHMQGNSAARIAAAEGAAPAAAPGKSSFIAAARRAAQAASQQVDPRAQRTDAAATATKKASLTAKVIKRIKSLFVAASIIAIVVGSVEIAANKFDLGIPLTKVATAPQTVPANESERATAAAEPAAPDSTASITANPAAPAEPPAAGSLTKPANSGAVATIPAPALSPLQPLTPSLFGPPVFPLNGDITGSIPTPPATANTAPQTAPSPSLEPQADNSLPAAIGSPKLRNAAIAGDAAAAYAVASRYAEGRGVPVNMEEAAHWYERAAAKGLALAQFRYASMLEKGVGVKKDLAQASHFYLAAAKKGNGKAMHNLAVLYAEGIDGKPDYADAVQWFRKAAEHGVADSQYNLAVLYARGLGTEKNFAEAYKWFALAAAQGDSEAAKKRDEIAPQLDDKAIAAAQQAVKSFVALPQPQDAVKVREPAGGWDHAAAAAHPRARPTGPLALGDFQAGKH